MKENNINNFDEYDAHIARIMSDWKVPGCAVAIIKDGKTIHSKGYGFRDVEKRLPVDTDTVFAIGSTSKAFTSAAVAILVDRGLLEWDTAVRRYIPEFDLLDGFAAERMTVRDLLSYRSGLPRHDALWYGTSFSRQELMERLKFLQPSTDFRTTFQYQNLMFMAAGYLVERVTGQTWEEFVQQNILEPLGMVHTTLSVEGINNDARAALPYSAGENGFQKLPYRDLNVISPAGGINSCLADLAKWLSIHLEGGSFENCPVISAESLAITHTAVTNLENSFTRLLQPFTEIGDEQYGLGWFMHDYRGHRMIRHGGHIDGFSTQISFMPDIGAGVIVLSNIGGSNYMFVPTFMAYDKLLKAPALDWSCRLLAEAEKTRQFSLETVNWLATKQIKNTIPSHPLADYAGSYCSAAYGEVAVNHHSGELSASFNGRIIQLTHYHFDTFEWNIGRPGSIPLKASFQTDWLGNVCGFELQLEPMVDPIQFDRQPDESLSTESVLIGCTGNYIWDEKPVRVDLLQKTNLRVVMPGLPEMWLTAYQPGLFKVQGHANWYVEFVDNPVTEFCLAQPSALIRAKRNIL